jgi:hypothetical protein
MHAELWQDYYLPFTHTGHMITPLMKFIAQLAKESSACCQAIVEAGIFDILMDFCFRNFCLPHVNKPMLLSRDDPKILEEACNTVERLLAADPFSLELSVHRIFIRSGYCAQRPGGRTLRQGPRYGDIRLDFIEVMLEFLDISFKGLNAECIL